MISIFNDIPSFFDIRSFFEQRKRIYAQKFLRMTLISVGAVVIAAATAIAISKIIPTIFMILCVMGLSVWGFLKIRKMELATLIDYIRDVIKKISDLLKEKKDELDQLKGDPARFTLLQLLSFVNDDEKTALENFANSKFEDADQFDLVVRKKATNSLGALFKRAKGMDKEFAYASYSDMIDLAGKKFKLNRDGRNDRDFEAHIVKSAFKKMIESMDEKDRKTLEHEINKYAEQHLGKKNLNITLSAAGLLAAKLGGFATYMTASSLLAGIGSVFGATFPFGAYTGLAAALGTAMGPIGFGAIGLWGLHKITSADVKTTILIVLAVASIRERLIYEHPEKREKLEKEIAFYSKQKSELEIVLVKIETEKNPDEAFLAVEQDIKPQAIEHLQKNDI